MDKLSGCVGMCQLKIQGETTELEKQHARAIEPDNDRPVINTVLGSRRECVRESLKIETVRF